MSACSKQSRPTAPKGGSPFAPTNSPTVSDRTPLANSPDWLKAAPMWENLLASWRQSGQKKDYCPSLLNHNAKYKRLLPPCCDFANGIDPFARLAPDMGEAEEVERGAMRSRVVGALRPLEAEVDEARLVGMEREPIPGKTLAQNSQDP